VSEAPAPAGEPGRFRFRVAGMDCASCARTIEQGVKELGGVDEVTVNFATELIEGRGRVAPGAIAERVESLGYRLVDTQAPEAVEPGARHGLKGFFEFVWRERETRVALLLSVLMLLLVPVHFGRLAAALGPAPTVLHWLVVVIVGRPIASRGLRSLIYARSVTIEVLMTAATLGALAIGASGEAVTVVLLYTLGEALEGYSAARSRRSLRRLLALRPARATLIREHDEGSGEAHRHYADVDVAALAPGDHVLVKSGERIPADGRIVDGTSAIDESAITGESLPVHRAAGDDVFAGTINGRGTLEVEVACRAEDSTISQIARLVEQAQAQRSPAENFIDRFARGYTPAVVAIAVAVALVPPLLLGAPFLTPAGDAPGWLYRGLALLIVACPCALIISIPVTVVSALTRLAGLGVLVKGGAQLSSLAKTRVLAFDKTGTLTHGRPSVVGVRSRKCAHTEASTDRCEPCDELVAVAASVERGSSHPLAHAVLEAAAERRLDHRYRTATDIESHAGRGVTGTLNGHTVTVGHPDLFEPSGELRELVAGRREDTGSLMLVGDDERLLGYIQVEDPLRPEARSVLDALKAIDPRYRLVMLTGDRDAVARRIAASTGRIDEVRAGLLPQQKLGAVRELETKYGDVAMIGDGVNDAPALAGARLGIAMGGAGSHQAMEVADIVLMRDDLEQLPLAVSISRKTQRLIRENIALSLGLKLAVLALAIPGLATLWMAVLADVGTTVLVTLNGMRMLRAKGSR
jgi:Cd2+/Zn2+-exporting ATPase